MADGHETENSQENASNSEALNQNGVEENDDTSPQVVESTGLVQFVMQEVQRQKMQVVDIEDQEEEQQAEEEVDQSRERNFVTSALSAIQKMNAEVDKSNKRRASLHEQFGAQRYHDWQQEHAREVLTNQEAGLVAAYNKII